MWKECHHCEMASAPLSFTFPVCQSTSTPNSSPSLASWVPIPSDLNGRDLARLRRFGEGRQWRFLSSEIPIPILHDPQLVDPRVFEMNWLESFGLMGKESTHGYFPGWFNVNIREMPISHSCGIHPELRVLSEVWSGWSRHRDLWQASDCLVFQGQKLNAVAILKKHNSCLSPNVKRKHV